MWIPTGWRSSNTVRVVRCEPPPSTLPPVQRKAFHERVLGEILQKQVAAAGATCAVSNEK